MEELIKKILNENNIKMFRRIERCNIGHGNYVFKLIFEDGNMIIRLNNESDLYNEYETYKYWASELKRIEIPVPNVITTGKFEDYNYILLEFIDGKDLGEVYESLTEMEKKRIAKDIIKMQKLVQDKLPQNNEFGSIYRYNDNTGFATWQEYILDSLENSKKNIFKNKIFDDKRVDKLIDLVGRYKEYFEKVEPKAFLDDISNKNLLIDNGKISGIVDLDWMGFGDLLYFVGYNNMALLDMEADTKYIDYMIQELNLDDFEKQIVLFYTLVFCVDFMSEKGQTFQDKVIFVDEKIVKKLNRIYDNLINKIL